MTDHTTQKFWDQYAKPGATHYNPETKDWYRVEGENALAWASIEGGWVHAAYWHERKHQCVARSGAQWDGTGKPPVGIDCEASLLPWPGHIVLILAHDEDQVVFRWKSGPHKGSYGSFLGGDAFRPLKTPAQLAAEKREAEQSEAFDKACEDIRDTIQVLAGYIPVDNAARRVVKAMIQQGYRKPEKE